MLNFIVTLIQSAIAEIFAITAVAITGFIWRYMKRQKGALINSYDVYISYPKPREQDAIALKKLLKKSGLSTFKDSDLEIGVDYKEELDLAMNKSKAVAFCISGDTKLSNGQQQEIGKAVFLIGNKDIIIIPVLLPSANYSDIPDAIKKYMAVDLRGGIIYENIVPFLSRFKR